ncbi:regulatory protein [Burkholderia lata]|uniref:H-NS histone family protein n=1 Tax=Burkholderia lata (strain ATCC 17760 / DSM 23089 / LMG 22485 / NCIMB 9086 / R18194 / 383) TaxID=482957 RepID=UPI001453247E|nr:H-NS histone family protein [Burkholderia lata]VWC48415.1 regulatory protein [Burkholderia lata]
MGSTEGRTISLGGEMNKFASFMQKKRELEAQIANDRALVRDEILIEVMTAIDEFHFDRDELFPNGKSRKLKPRYFDPESGAIWSGRGREPLWLRGKDRKDYELDADESDDATDDTLESGIDPVIPDTEPPIDP